MSAVDDLLLELGEIDVGVDFLTDPLNPLPPPIGATLSRGLAVRGLVALEQFMRSRGYEWTHALNQARIAPTAWPGGQAAIQDRLIKTLPRNYSDLTIAQRGLLIEEIGRSFGSLTTGTLVSHSIKFSWPGSNVQASDVEAMLSLVGAGDKPWGELTALWSRVDPRYPGNLSAKSLFEDVAKMRHDAAHSAQPLLGLANLGSITRNVRLLSICVDALMSGCLSAIFKGVQPRTVKGSSIPLRKVIKDGTKWREFNPGVTSRARARHPDLPTALREAAARTPGGSELVLCLDGNDIINWRTAV